MRDNGGAGPERAAPHLRTPIEPPAKGLPAHFPHRWGKDVVQRTGRILFVGVVGAVALAMAAQAEDTLVRLNGRETTLALQQGRNLNELSRLLTVLMRYRRDPPPALIVSPGDALDAARAAILVKAITPELSRRARVYSVQAGEIARQRRLAAVASEALFMTDSVRADLSHAAPEVAPALRGALDGPGGVAPRALQAPTSGTLIHRFGDGLTGGGKAQGVTYLTQVGASVRAPDGGSVQFVGPVKGWGVVLILRLAGGYHLVLAGMDRVTVGVGQSLIAGQAVGQMPDERSGPSELYLEVRDRDAPVNPERWLKAAA